MSPRPEFVLASAALALLLAIVAYVANAHGGQISQWGTGVWRALVVAVPAASSAALGARLALAWQRRALVKSRRWSAVGLNWRVVLLSYLLFPLLMTLWMVGATLFDYFTANPGGTLADNLLWLPLAAIIFSGLAIAFGAIPAFILEYFVCRRYLRRTAVTTGSA